MEKCRKKINFSKYSLPIVFVTDIHEGHSSIGGSDNKQNSFADELKNFDKAMKRLLKSIFWIT